MYVYHILVLTRMSDVYCLARSTYMYINNLAYISLNFLPGSDLPTLSLLWRQEARQWLNCWWKFPGQKANESFGICILLLNQQLITTSGEIGVRVRIQWRYRYGFESVATNLILGRYSRQILPEVLRARHSRNRKQWYLDQYHG